MIECTKRNQGWLVSFFFSFRPVIKVRKYTLLNRKYIAIVVTMGLVNAMAANTKIEKRTNEGTETV